MIARWGGGALALIMACARHLKLDTALKYYGQTGMELELARGMK
jgi:hypothetical protein